MQDCCEDPIEEDALNSQYVSVEIDTQATDRYDEPSLDKEVPMPLDSNQEPRYAMPPDEDELIVDFKFGKANIADPVLWPSKSSVEAAKPLPEMPMDSREESRCKNSGDLFDTILNNFREQYDR